MKRMVPPKMTSAIVKRSPSRKGPSPIADTIASSMALWLPQPTEPSRNSQPAALAIEPGSITEGEKSDQRR